MSKKQKVNLDDLRFLSIDTVARLLEIHPKTVQKYIRQGVLKSDLIEGNRRISMKEYLNFTRKDQAG